MTDKFSRIFFVLALFLFLVLRLLPVLTAVERISHYDELDIGVIAKEFLAGPRLPLWHYQMDSYGGESIVLGALAVPFIWALGPTLLAVKIPSLLFSLLNFCLIYCFLKRHFSLSAAQRGILLYIFAPASVVHFSSAALSGHAEAITFGLLAFMFCLDLIKTPKKISALALGLSLGFGFWFYHENLIYMTTCGFLLIGRAAIQKKFESLSLIFLGTLIGLIPWLGYLLHYQSEGFSFLQYQTLLTFRNIFDLRHIFEKLIQLTTRDIPLSFAFFPILGIHEKIFSILYFVFFALPVAGLAAAAAVKKFRDPRYLLLILFFFVFSILFCISPFVINPAIGWVGYRYLAPYHFLLLILSAVLLDREIIKRVILVSGILLGALSQTPLYFQEPFARAQEYRGYSYYRIATQWFYSLHPVVKDTQDLLKLLKQRDPDAAFFLLWGFANTAFGERSETLLQNTRIGAEAAPLAEESFNRELPFLYKWIGGIQTDTDSLSKILAQYPPSKSPYIERGYFKNNIFQHIGDLSDLPRVIRESNQPSPWFYTNLGKYFHSTLHDNPESKNFLGDLKESYAREAARQLKLQDSHAQLVHYGKAIGHQHVLWDSNQPYNRSLEIFIRQLDSKEKQSFAQGLGWVIRSIHRTDRQRALNRMDEIPADLRSSAMIGFQEFEDWYAIPQDSL